MIISVLSLQMHRHGRPAIPFGHEKGTKIMGSTFRYAPNRLICNDTSCTHYAVCLKPC